MVARAETLGCEVVRLKSNRLSGLPDTYRDAKTTRAVITAPPPAGTHPAQRQLVGWPRRSAGRACLRQFSGNPGHAETGTRLWRRYLGGVRASEGTT